MKNLYWLSIAFGLVVSGFFLADRRFTEVGLIGTLICVGLTLGLGLLWFRPRPMWQGILWGALAQPVVVSLNDQMVGVSNKLGLTYLDAAFYSPLPEETIKLLGVVIIIAAFGNVKQPYQAAAIGMAVGLGFNAMENVPFILHAAIDNLDGDLWGVIITGIGRFFTGAFSLHCIRGLRHGASASSMRARATGIGRWPDSGWPVSPCIPCSMPR